MSQKPTDEEIGRMFDSLDTYPEQSTEKLITMTAELLECDYQRVVDALIANAERENAK